MALKTSTEISTLLGKKHTEHLWVKFLAYTERILSWFAFRILITPFKGGGGTLIYKVKRFSWISSSFFQITFGLLKCEGIRNA